eukprot:1838800-Pyramimonas_sp.AAC.1
MTSRPVDAIADRNLRLIHNWTGGQRTPPNFQPQHCPNMAVPCTVYPLAQSQDFIIRMADPARIRVGGFTGLLSSQERIANVYLGAQLLARERDYGVQNLSLPDG